MSEHAAWWDNPDAQGDDSPVIRHAPDAHNYHVPDSEQMGKMPRMRSRSGRFALIPAANRDGSSKGFDPTVAGPVHVDPDAPDGGVVFDPDSVRKSDVNRAVAHAVYPHQAYYQLGTAAPLLGVGTKKQAAYAAQAYAQNGFDVDTGRNPHMPNTYVTPSSSSQTGRLSEVPTFVANGYGGGPASYNPTYRAQEEQAVNPVPPLNSLPPLGPSMVPGPQPVQTPQPMQQPPQHLAQAPQAYPQPQPQYPQPQAGYYAPPNPYQPPPLDPNMQAMMQGMVAMQQQMAALAQQVNRPAVLPPTTGLSPVPLPTRAPQLTTQPVEQGRGRQPHPDSEDFDDEAARPIRKQVKRNKTTQDIEAEEDTGRSLVRRTVREHEQEEPQTVREYQEQDREPEGVIVGFESLGMKFVNGPLGNKPKKQVVFEIPGAGKHMARFHDVVDGGGCVVLIYDTRYEEGQQYVPPELDENTPITLHIKTGKDQVKTYKVGSMGLNYSCGVFDHIVMVKVGDQAVNYEADEE